MLKKSLLAVITLVILILIGYGYYKYQLNQFMTLQPTDKQTILNSFAPDSENRGYSDKAKVMLENDRKILKDSGLDLENQMNISKTIEKSFKKYRLLLLSDNQVVYLEREKSLKTTIKCIYYFLEDVPLDKIRNLSVLTDDIFNIETENFMTIDKILKEKYHYKLNDDVIKEIQNPLISKEICLNEINK